MQMKNREWGTKSEIEYLNKIGEAHKDTAIRVGKRKLLESYLSALMKRVNFGNMDRDKVFLHAHKLLAVLPW